MASNSITLGPARRVGRAALALAFVVGMALVLYRVADFRPAAQDGSAVDGGQSESAVLLVNAEHPLPDGYSPPELVSLVDVVPVSGSDVSVAAEVEKPLRTLFGAARKAGLKNLYVASGYRSDDVQQAMWDEAEDKSYVQPAGHSEHATGLAVDLADLKVGQGGFGDSKAGKWLAKNAWRYGFILRYPAGKEEITGISYEPWHFRYVGKAIAKACQEQHLTLEEYVAGH